jgi:hypothetical protein
MANTAAQFVIDTYKADLGGLPKTDALIYWASKIQSGEMTEAEVKAAIQGSAEGIAYAETGVPDPARAAVTGTSADFDNDTTTTAATNGGNQGSQAVTPAQVQSLYQELLGRQGADENVMNWVNSGMSIDEIRSAIAGSPEGLNYAQYGIAASLDNPGVLPTGDATADGTTNFNPLIQQYYQELFNRQAQQPGLDYFAGRLGSGDLTEDTLRDAIIAGAQGSDRLYYDASQSGGPVFDATQALFGRRPARGTYNPETGQLEGGYGQYRSQIDAGELTPEQLRRNLVQLAYNRGEGGGSSADYQAYLNSLGIDRGGRPFLQDDGTYANIAYGSDVSDYNRTYGQQGQLPDFPFPGAGSGMFGKGGGRPMPGGQYTPPSYGGRMPGQYITGNQLYSGMPYGMSQPMGMFAQPMIYQPPQFSEQYMPNRGLMSGYSTGFGPYGGYRRPYGFGGGKGGPRIMRPMGGKGGFGY